MDVAKKPNPVIAALITVVILVGLTAAIVYFDNVSDDVVEPVTSEMREVDTSGAENAEGYEDGTYEAEGFYSTPGGTDSIVLTVELENGVIVDTELEQRPTSGNAEEFQSRFASGYEELVVGRDIDEVRLSRVAGSSLTSNGFNDALEKIREEASDGNTQ